LLLRDGPRSKRFAERRRETSGLIGDCNGTDRKHYGEDGEAHDPGDPTHASSAAHGKRLASATAVEINGDEAGAGEPDHASEWQQDAEERRETGDKQAHPDGNRIMETGGERLRCRGDKI